MKQKIYFEVLWICVTLTVICLVLMPIYMNLGDGFPFYRDNILLILISITFTRYLFLLKHHWIVNSKWFKVILIFFPIIVLLYLVDVLYNFQLYNDQEGIKSLMEGLPYKAQRQMELYIKSEMIFFWVTAFISNFLLPFRMVMSLWKKINKGSH